MKYLKYFNEDAEYQQFKETDEYILPNVSFVVNSDTVNYNPYIVETKETRVACTYNVTSTTSATQLCYYVTGITSMEIDGIMMDKVTTGYTFNTLGEHTVKFELVDPTTIGDYAFNSCKGLTSVVIPDSVTSIGSGAFDGCSSLTSVVIPDSVTKINYSAFGYCSSLTSVVIPDSVTYIGGSAFIRCTNLTSVEIGSGVTTIGSSAFTYCIGLTGELVIPNSVTYIGDGAFYNCSGLTGELIIPDSVTEIRKGAFNNCCGLESIVVEEGNSNYDSRENCNCLIKTSTNTLIKGCNNSFIPNSVTSIDEWAFWGCSGLTGELVIPNSVKTISDGAFDGCYSLTSLVIGSGVTSIGAQAFYYCSGLTGELVIPSGVTTIGRSAFSGCRSLASVVIPNSVTKIDGSAFSGCRSLASVVIGSGVTTIDSYAFFQCAGLREIVCHAPTAPTIKSSTFENVAQYGTLIYPEGSDYSSWLSTSSYYLGYYKWNVVLSEITATYNVTGTTSATKLLGTTSGIVEIVVDGVKLNSVVTGYTFNTTGEHTVIYKMDNIPYLAFNGCIGLTSVVIPNSVTKIDGSAFSGCRSLASVVVEEGNPVYDSRENCNCIIETSTNTLIKGFKNSVIPNSVTSIGKGAFSYCYGLTSLVIPNSVTSISEQAFYQCTGLTSVEIGSGVTEIDARAFGDCYSLKSVVIGSGVTSIGSQAFNNCTSLREIVCHAPTAPTIKSSTFYNIKTGGVLKVPAGSDYLTWMSTSSYYLGYYKWTMENI